MCIRDSCGVCHSDLSLIDGAFPAFTPMILGHEAAGIVEEVGAGVRSLQPGDRVILSPCPSCGSCYWCQRAEWSICESSRSLMTATHPDGGTRLSRNGEIVYRGTGMGAFAESVVVAEAGAIQVPDDVPLEIACVIGCSVQTGVGAVLNTAAVEHGATVLIMGLGGVGLSAVQGAVVAGAARIIASDPVKARRDLASRFGATDLVDPHTTDVVVAAMEATGGIGVDYAFDAAGRVELVQQAIDATRIGGTTVMVGVPPLGEELTYSSATLFTAMEKKLLGCLLGSSNSRRDVPMLLSLWRQGRLDLDGMITSRRSLDDINAALDDLRSARGIRTVISVGA
ncbi:MAG: Zn-dependent alcohol dehydrogenase [Acidimicrobiales bacterium]|nr:Zn-dependent alcohol dehydrogenase [Acidimicrobiales bacterium]